MDPLHYYRVPLKNKDQSPFATIPGFESRMTEALFELKTFRFAGVRAHIYECLRPGCPGCGCPVFEGEIPQEVHDHLHLHVEVCAGLVRNRVRQ